MQPDDVAKSLEGRGELNSFAINRTSDMIVADVSYVEHEGTLGEMPSYFINLCLSGSGLLRQKSNSQALEGWCNPGTFGLAPAWSHVEGKWPALRVLHLGMSRERLASILEDEASSPEAIPEVVVNRLRKNAVVSAALGALADEARHGSISSSYCDHLAAVAVLAMVRVEPSGNVSKIRPLDIVQVRRVLDHIESNLTQDINVADLAAITNLSRSHFTRAFQTATGIAPYAYINGRRAKRAAEYLSGSSLPITEIANIVGYSNAGHFASAFRKCLGMSPTEWRRRS